MKAVAFDYLRPRDVTEAVAALASRSDAKLLAGGQSLGPMLNLRLVRPALLIDVSRIEALRRIEDGGAAWHIGGSVTHAQIEDAQGQMQGGEMLCEVAAGIAYRAVRNRGTVAGSLAHADPAADWPLALAALSATVLVRDSRGATRPIPADQFMVATFTTQLRPDEIIERIEVPKLGPSARYGYFKFCRKTGEFPEASAAVVVDPQRGSARVFIGALQGAPQALPGIAETLSARGAAAVKQEAVADAVAAAAPALDPIDRRVHVTTVLRAIQRAFPQ